MRSWKHSDCFEASQLEGWHVSLAEIRGKGGDYDRNDLPSNSICIESSNPRSNLVGEISIRMRILTSCAHNVNSWLDVRCSRQHVKPSDWLRLDK